MNHTHDYNGRQNYRQLTSYISWRVVSNPPEVFQIKGFPKVCSNLQEKTLAEVWFIEITFWHECSPVNLLHIAGTTFPENTSGGLYLHIFQCHIVFDENVIQLNFQFSKFNALNNIMVKVNDSCIISSLLVENAGAEILLTF